MELTAAARNKDKSWVVCQDGTPVDGKHVEGVVIKTLDGRISLIPVVQGSKKSEDSADGFVEGLDAVQMAYNDFYHCLEKYGVITQG